MNICNAERENSLNLKSEKLEVTNCVKQRSKRSGIENSTGRSGRGMFLVSSTIHINRQLSVKYNGRIPKLPQVLFFSKKWQPIIILQNLENNRCTRI